MDDQPRVRLVAARRPPKQPACGYFHRNTGGIIIGKIPPCDLPSSRKALRPQQRLVAARRPPKQPACGYFHRNTGGIIIGKIPPCDLPSSRKALRPQQSAAAKTSTRAARGDQHRPLREPNGSGPHNFCATRAVSACMPSTMATGWKRAYFKAASFFRTSSLTHTRFQQCPVQSLFVTWTP